MKRNICRQLGWIALSVALATDAGAIIGGTQDSGHPAVALMLDTMTGIECSGSLIAPQVLLTAAECIAGDSDASHYTVLGGATAFAAPDWSVGVSSVVVNPAYDFMTFSNDVGVLLLASAPPVSPFPWLATDPGGAYFPGIHFTAVGYGVSNAQSESGDGVRRMVGLTISIADASTFRIDATGGKSPCIGDQGGPALEVVNQVETVIGTFAYGDQACAQFAVYERTDANATFIAAYAPEPGAATSGGVASALLAWRARRRACSS